jgi:hypothetical protein
MLGTKQIWDLTSDLLDISDSFLHVFTLLIPRLIGFKQPNYDLEYPHRYDRFRTYTIIYVYNVNKIDKELKYLVHIKS